MKYVELKKNTVIYVLNIKKEIVWKKKQNKTK